MQQKEADSAYREMAKPYQKDMDFAFFAVNFGYTKQDYLELTDRERLFIYKAYENKLVSQSTVMRDAVFNAVNNALRKRGKPFAELWKKLPTKADKEIIREHVSIIQEIEKKETGWIEKIYQANGMKPLRKDDKNG